MYRCVKINNTEYPVTVSISYQDTKWGNRQSVTIYFNEDYKTVKTLLPDNIEWFVIEKRGDTKEEIDMSDYCIAGEITDHRDGRVSIKMGKKTEEEQLKEIEEAYND